MHIVGISSSLRDNSVSRQMVARVLSAAEAQGVQTDLIDLKNYPNLPFCDDRPGSYGPQAESLKARLNRADAFVIATPEYHGGYSGALKNFIDISGMKPFQDKLVGLVGAAGGRLGAEASLNQLRVVFKSIESIVLPQQVGATGQDVTNGALTATPVLDRLDAMADKMVTLGERFNRTA